LRCYTKAASRPMTAFGGGETTSGGGTTTEITYEETIEEEVVDEVTGEVRVVQRTVVLEGEEAKAAMKAGAYIRSLQSST